MKKKFSLRCETTNENRVFKPWIYIPKLTSSQARGSFVFDPRDYYSLFLLKGFGFCNFDFRDYAFRLTCDLGLCPLEKKVRTVFTFDPGTGSLVQFLHKILRRPFELINHGVTNLFNFCVGDTSKWFPPKEGGYKHKLCPTQGMSDFQVFGSNYANSIDKRAGDDVKFFSRKWPDLGTNHFKEGGDDTATPRAHFWTSSLSIACKPMRAELVQFLFVELRLARFQLTRAQVSSIELNLATIQLIYFIG